MRLALWLAVLFLAASGCFSEPAARNDPPVAVPCPPSCAGNHTLSLVVELVAMGTHSVGTPFPHGAWCLQPQEWSVAATSPRTRAATAELRSTENATLLWVTSGGNGRFHASIDLANRSECQTFRYDPWSIEPDPADGMLDILADGAYEVYVGVEHRRGSCTDFETFHGQAQQGWNAIRRIEDLTRCT